MHIRSLTISFFLCLLFNAAHTQPVTTILKGKVITRESEALYLLKITDDTRGNKELIPIRDGKFEYTLVAEEVEAYQLIFKEELERGAWRPIRFINDDGAVNITLYDTDNFHFNESHGGEQNQHLAAYRKAQYEVYEVPSQDIWDTIAVLREKGLYLSDEMAQLEAQLAEAEPEQRKQLYRQMSELREAGKDLSPSGKVWQEKNMQNYTRYKNWRLQYIDAHPTLATYSLLIQDLLMLRETPENLEEIQVAYSKLAKLYPEHSYNQLAYGLIVGVSNLKTGGRFIDFTAPDLQGRPVTISEKISDNITLLDFWASWCGPCIKTSRTMVPLYEKYKDKGFNIIGVAREFKNSERLEKALEREQFPWLNLLELDDVNHIWAKYNIPFSGGKTFLVDKDGTILAVHPTAEEVEEILKERLK